MSDHRVLWHGPAQQRKLRLGTSLQQMSAGEAAYQEILPITWDQV
jgi:hypothetical protein